MPHRKLPPRRVYWSAVVTAAISTPLSLLIMAAWMLGLVEEEHAVSVVMLFTLMITLAITALAVAGVAAAYSAVHLAFAAGFQTGQASVDPGDPDPLVRARLARQRGERDPLLKLVNVD